MAVGVFRQGPQFLAGVAKAVRHPRVGAEEDHQVGVFDALGGMTDLRAEQVAVEPEIAGLLLGERTVEAGAAERADEADAVGPAEVIALAAAAVEGEAFAAVELADLTEPRGDLASRCPNRFRRSRRRRGA